jgi:hypothetical protein
VELFLKVGFFGLIILFLFFLVVISGILFSKLGGREEQLILKGGIYFQNYLFSLFHGLFVPNFGFPLRFSWGPMEQDSVG